MIKKLTKKKRINFSNKKVNQHFTKKKIEESNISSLKS